MKTIYLCVCDFTVQKSIVFTIYVLIPTRFGLGPLVLKNVSYLFYENHEYLMLWVMIIHYNVVNQRWDSSKGKKDIDLRKKFSVIKLSTSKFPKTSKEQFDEIRKVCASQYNMRDVSSILILQTIFTFAWQYFLSPHIFMVHIFEVKLL